MTRTRLVLAALAAVPLLAAAPAGAATPVLLQGYTGPGFTIGVKLGGKAVKRLKPGTYRLRVQDKSSIHNFRLKGPGLNKQVTTVSFVGTKTITVKLRKGVYTFVCDPHAAAGMKGTFRVA